MRLPSSSRHKRILSSLPPVGVGDGSAYPRRDYHLHPHTCYICGAFTTLLAHHLAQRTSRTVFFQASAKLSVPAAERGRENE